MNLAALDIRHHFGRFILTSLGIGLLLMIVLGMSGIYRGMIDDALVVVERIGTDLWIVQKGTRGPFAEISRIPASMENRLLSVPGVKSARKFISHNVQRDHAGRPLRMSLHGLAWPDDKGDWVPLLSGRPLGQAHYEMIADQTLGLSLGETLQLGKDSYRVVGISKGMVASGGDGIGFFSASDAQSIQLDQPGEAIRLERSARMQRAAIEDIGRLQPLLLERGQGPSSELPALSPPQVSAVMVRIQDGANLHRVKETIEAWADVSVHTKADQEKLLVYGMIDKARRQIGLFRVLLVVISTIIMALILYTMTLDKIHDIALLKLMGARNRMIIGLILQQALLLGFIGYGIANLLGQWVFPRFPRRVLITSQDLWALAGVVLLISVFASLIGIRKAMNVEPNKVLS